MNSNIPFISIIVAIAENGVIGRDNGLPWQLSTDMKRFRAITMGKPVIMGRKTWDSIGRPLPGRVSVVITRDADFAVGGVDVAHSMDDALAVARMRAVEAGVDEICVIGGGDVYRQTLPLADRLHVTEVLDVVEGDTLFPPIERERWREVSMEELPAGEKDSHATRYIVYERGDL